MAWSDSQAPGHLSTPLAEINTTPLVDVMLVLLVVFLITAPLLQRALPVDLPQVSGNPAPETGPGIRLSLDAQGQLLLEDSPCPWEELTPRLAARLAGQTNPELRLWADRDTRYQRLSQLMAAVQQAGIQRIAFVTEAPQGGNLE